VQYGQPYKATFSICAVDPAAGEVGVAVQSRYFAVGTVVPWARAGVGAAATQAAGVAAFGPQVLSLLESGLEPEAALARVLEPDDGRETRQLGVVTAVGRAAAFTGSECNPWAGHQTADGLAVQGNILAGADVVAEMRRAYVETDGSLAERLVSALEAGQEAGGDVRGQQSAALVVERRGAASELREGIDRVCDLRVDDHPEPIAELRRLLGIRLRWDVLAAAHRHYERGAFAEGARLLAAGVERFPGDTTLLYDLACYECRSGTLEPALAHLRAAVEADPGMRASATRDSDFEALAGNPEFKALVEP
jgi:uncharacterized Ntn-hydrolase superfamily protein